ncbi:MAG: hypothetical protein ACLFUS_07405 [Candidatus Sumerlaeia bacterium]
MKQICESCGKTIEKPEVAFRLKIDMFADPTPPEITLEDMDRDFSAELRELVEGMDALDHKEAEDEVFESYLFTLCSKCRGQLHKLLKNKTLPLPREDEEAEGLE